MARMRLYDCKTVRNGKGKRTVYYPGYYHDLPSEWTVGEPPAAWPEDQERPECNPPKPEPEEEEQEAGEPEGDPEEDETDGDCPPVEDFAE